MMESLQPSEAQARKRNLDFLVGRMRERPAATLTPEPAKDPPHEASKSQLLPPASVSPIPLTQVKKSNITITHETLLGNHQARKPTPIAPMPAARKQTESQEATPLPSTSAGPFTSAAPVAGGSNKLAQAFQRHSEKIGRVLIRALADMWEEVKPLADAQQSSQSEGGSKQLQSTHADVVLGLRQEMAAAVLEGNRRGEREREMALGGAASEGGGGEDDGGGGGEAEAVVRGLREGGGVLLLLEHQLLRLSLPADALAQASGLLCADPQQQQRSHRHFQCHQNQRSLHCRRNRHELLSHPTLCSGNHASSAAA